MGEHEQDEGQDLADLIVDEAVAPAAEPEQEQSEEPPDEEQEKKGPSAEQQRLNFFALPEKSSKAPPWAKVPKHKDFKIPRGAQVLFLRFPPEMTAAPQKGERQCIVWTLSLGDTHAAVERARGLGSAERGIESLTKQMVRAIDGQVADWSGAGGAADIDQFWRDIGPKCRTILQTIYTQLHVPTQAELAHFFVNCIAHVSTG